MGRKARIIVLAALLLAGGTGISFAAYEEGMRATEGVIQGASFSQQEKGLLLHLAREAVEAGVDLEDVKVIVAGAVETGMDATMLQRLLQLIMSAAHDGLPPVPVANTIQQGIAKAIAPERIVAAAERVGLQLRSAAVVVQHTEAHGVLPGPHAVRLRAIEQVAIALRSGISGNELEELGRIAAKSKTTLALYGRAVECAATVGELGLSREQAMSMARQGLLLGYSDRRYAQMERQLMEYHRSGMSGDESFREMNSFMERTIRGSGRPAASVGGRGTGTMPSNNSNMRMDRK